ncbi:hypothetical protein [Streptomyces sp. NPDC058664]|uniref:hypothetical protein n=1 Tax=unclassified Streptomyces TaxID=2593676 RepID=UPI003651CDF4
MRLFVSDLRFFPSVSLLQGLLQQADTKCRGVAPAPLALSFSAETQREHGSRTQGETVRIRITSAAACLALAITGPAVAAGSASAAEQGEGHSVGQSADRHGGPQWPVPVPPEVGDLICEIQAHIPNSVHIPYPVHTPHPVQIPRCKPVNGWQ